MTANFLIGTTEVMATAYNSSGHFSRAFSYIHCYPDFIPISNIDGVIKAWGATGDVLKVVWGGNSYAQYYELEVSYSKGGSYMKVIDLIKTKSSIYDYDYYSYQRKGVYGFRVRGLNPFYVSEWSTMAKKKV
jgi:hypothetical protein